MKRFLQIIGAIVIVVPLVCALAITCYWVYLFGFTMPRIGH